MSMTLPCSHLVSPDFKRQWFQTAPGHKQATHVTMVRAARLRRLTSIATDGRGCSCAGCRCPSNSCNSCSAGSSVIHDIAVAVCCASHISCVSRAGRGTWATWETSVGPFWNSSSSASHGGLAPLYCRGDLRDAHGWVVCAIISCITVHHSTTCSIPGSCGRMLRRVKSASWTI